MTGFFMLSGFSLHYSYKKKDLHNIKNVEMFYIKRCMGILPIYYITSIIYIVFVGNESLFQNIILAPAEALGIQSFFTSLFSISHNSGTWFISCILFCYLLFPFLSEMIKQMGIKAKLILEALCIFILLYAPFVVYIFKLQTIYSNPFFRFLEFVIGVILASCMEDIFNYRIIKAVLSHWHLLVIELSLLVTGVSILYKLGIARSNYMLYSWIALPIFCLMLITLTKINFECIEKIKCIVLYMSKVSYSFFLAQFLTWPITIKNIGNGGDYNGLKILVSLIICSLIAVLLYECIEKPCKRLFNKIDKEKL